MYPIDEFKFSLIKKFVNNLYEKKNDNHVPLIIGMQGIQGCGKSFTCRKLKNDFEEKGIRTIVLSLDDFYYDRDHMGDQIRGRPGTHDIEFLCKVIDKLKKQETCRIPIYDKYAKNGEGDRKGYKLIEIDSSYVQIILIEGWCIGFSSHSTINEPWISLNEHVKKYENLLTTRLNAIVVLVANADKSFEWRLQAEKNAKIEGHSGMNDEEIITFVSHYIPVYKLYLNNMKFKIPTCQIYL